MARSNDRNDGNTLTGEQNIITIKALPAMIEIAHQSQRPLFIWGAPGVGKSACVNAYGAKINATVIDLRLSMLDIPDLRGIPYPTDDRSAVRWIPPAFLPIVGREHLFPADKPVLVFLDEMNLALPSLMATAYQMINDRRVGEYDLLPNVYCLAAGNRESDGCGVHQMPQALRNRFLHVQVEPDIDGWVAWALRHGIDEHIIAWLRFEPDWLFKFDPKERSNAFPSPRTWEFVSDIEKRTIPQGQSITYYSTAVGYRAAADYFAFKQVANEIPDIPAIERNPELVKVPDKRNVQFVTYIALVMRAEKKNFNEFLYYMQKPGFAPEFATVFARDAVTRDPSLAETEAYINWAVKHPELVI